MIKFVILLAFAIHELTTSHVDESLGKISYLDRISINHFFQYAIECDSLGYKKLKLALDALLNFKYLEALYSLSLVQELS